MLELTPRQMEVLERLFAAGFRPIAIPPYENALCVKRGECAALLTPLENGGLRRLTPAWRPFPLSSKRIPRARLVAAWSEGIWE
jgi:hypothetical protein